MTSYPPTLWITYSFAPDWFNDLLNEARRLGHDARRREIIFAVCFAETYLFEWVRDDVLHGDFERLKTYFPPDKKRRFRDKWKDIPKELKDATLIRDVPYTGDSHGAEWDTLIDYRDGFVHASASRPKSPSETRDKKVASRTALDAVEAAWAARIVIERVRRLHKAAATVPPAWLNDP